MNPFRVICSNTLSYFFFLQNVKKQLVQYTLSAKMAPFRVSKVSEKDLEIYITE